MPDKIFVNGMIVRRHQNAPDFVICNLAFESGNFVKFLGDHSKKGYVNVVIKRSKNDKLYAELDTYVPKGENTPEVTNATNEVKTAPDPLFAPNSPIVEEVTGEEEIDASEIPF